jgi:branched-chain amino acid transport system permease protein
LTPVDGRPRVVSLLTGRVAARSWAAAGVVAAVLLPVVLSDAYMIQQALMVAFFTYLAAAWNISGGFAGQISLGHAAFFGIGAYTSTLLLVNARVTPWVGMLLGGFLAALVAAVVGYVFVRARGIYFILLTLAFAEILRIVVSNTLSVAGIEIGGSSGLNVPLLGSAPLQFQFERKEPYYLIAVAMMVGGLALAHAVKVSKLGYYLAAIRQDPDAAQAVGVDVVKYKVLSLALSGFLMGLGGTYYAQLFLTVDPERVLGASLSVDIYMIVQVGGAGTVLGPLIGAVVLVPMAEIVRVYFGAGVQGVHLILYGVILILVVGFMPHGIHGALVRGLTELRRPGARPGAAWRFSA